MKFISVYIKFNYLDVNANFEKNFDQLLKECKKNKISHSLLYLSKALYFNGSSPGKYSKQQKELIEVFFFINLKLIACSFLNYFLLL